MMFRSYLRILPASRCDLLAARSLHGEDVVGLVTDDRIEDVLEAAERVAVARRLRLGLGSGLGLGIGLGLGLGAGVGVGLGVG